jgi:hypothetical protein
MNWKVPPQAKVYEALTAIVDGRVQLDADDRAMVKSSDLSKTYTVRWNDERTAFGSNDNASYWQGYMGYPIVAVLMLLGLVPFDRTLADHLSGVEWKRVNDRHKRNYDAAIQEVLNKIEVKEHGVAQRVINEVTRIHSHLKKLELARLGSPTAKPPESK